MKVIYQAAFSPTPFTHLQLFTVCQSLINNGERYEEEAFLGRARLEALRALCRMCPSQLLMIRLKCVSNVKIALKQWYLMYFLMF